MTDTLPAGVTVASTPYASTTCPAGAATATAGGSSVALGGGTIAANATCTISVDVTGTVAATYTNTIAASALLTTQGVSNSMPATANLTIDLAAITLSKAFAPSTIPAGGTSTLTVTIPNTAPGAVALTAVKLTDVLPSGVTVAATPNTSTTCPAGVISIAAGMSVKLSNATLAANATCTFSVDVTGTIAATYTNTIAADALTNTEGVTNSAPASANLTIDLAAITLSKAFAPSTIS
ncbi:MAG: hypothetical protein IAI50_09040, partial [Candidatus Eremiobacteraeota bacterium]|nr:hypothetical protein [Candidatus Eremiobacteraeota bacterium]